MKRKREEREAHAPPVGPGGDGDREDGQLLRGEGRVELGLELASKGNGCRTPTASHGSAWFVAAGRWRRGVSEAALSGKSGCCLLSPCDSAICGGLHGMRRLPTIPQSE